jgi:hypothetical protein
MYSNRGASQRNQSVPSCGIGRQVARHPFAASHGNLRARCLSLRTCSASLDTDDSGIPTSLPSPKCAGSGGVSEKRCGRGARMRLVSPIGSHQERHHLASHGQRGAIAMAALEFALPHFGQQRIPARSQVRGLNQHGLQMRVALFGDRPARLLARGFAQRARQSAKTDSARGCQAAPPVPLPAPR